MVKNLYHFVREVEEGTYVNSSACFLGNSDLSSVRDLEKMLLSVLNNDSRSLVHGASTSTFNSGANVSKSNRGS